MKIGYLFGLWRKLLNIIIYISGKVTLCTINSAIEILMFPCKYNYFENKSEIKYIDRLIFWDKTPN